MMSRNLAKVLAGKRALPAKLRKRVNELIAKGNEVGNSPAI